MLPSAEVVNGIRVQEKNKNILTVNHVAHIFVLSFLLNNKKKGYFECDLVQNVQ